eukprot:scaffold30933_cov26-Tisochrysis_lutea.AAC.1
MELKEAGCHHCCASHPSICLALVNPNPATNNREKNGVNSNNASVMAAELHGDAAGAERAGVCLEGQQIKREISTATSVSLDTNI